MGVTFLLDTHVLLRLLGEPDRVPQQVRRTLADRREELLVSSASALEISSKVRLGKLPIASGLVDGWKSRVAEISAQTLDITTEHALAAGGLAWGHRDPFDRLLVAQALVENVTLVTGDRAILEFPGLKTLAV